MVLGVANAERCRGGVVHMYSINVSRNQASIEFCSPRGLSRVTCIPPGEEVTEKTRQGLQNNVTDAEFRDVAAVGGWTVVVMYPQGFIRHFAATAEIV